MYFVFCSLDKSKMYFVTQIQLVCIFLFEPVISCNTFLRYFIQHWINAVSDVVKCFNQCNMPWTDNGIYSLLHHTSDQMPQHMSPALICSARSATHNVAISGCHGINSTAQQSELKYHSIKQQGHERKVYTVYRPSFQFNKASLYIWIWSKYTVMTILARDSIQHIHVCLTCYMLSHVRPSVCLSVCPSQIIQKRLKLGL